MTGSATPSERDELAARATSDQEIAEEVLVELMMSGQWKPETATEDLPESIRTQRMLDRILAADRKAPRLPQAGQRVRWHQTWRRIAAAAMITVASGGGYLYLNRTPNDMPAKETAHSPAAPTDHIRTIVLPDSSLVVLQAGSTLTFPKTFGEQKREVQLVGEAFFDIRQITEGENRKPFIIHSGKIKTTVLGTSFNIKAYPDQPEVVVSVLKGKVQIEDQTHILAVLTQDQQISYRPETPDQIETHFEATKSIEWTRANLEFKGESFEEIAGILEKRFDVTIRFKTGTLKDCITIAAFKGTETLENILEILCTIRGARYEFEGPAQVLIDGDGC